jgi:hypothetical protein
MCWKLKGLRLQLLGLGPARWRVVAMGAIRKVMELEMATPELEKVMSGLEMAMQR